MGSITRLLGLLSLHLSLSAHAGGHPGQVQKWVDLPIQDYKQSQMRKQEQSDNANCEKYTAQVAEFEHRLRRGYSREEKRLSDTSHLSQFKTLKTRYCM
jgi:hypothetical protein